MKNNVSKKFSTFDLSGFAFFTLFIWLLMVRDLVRMVSNNQYTTLNIVLVVLLFLIGLINLIGVIHSSRFKIFFTTGKVKDKLIEDLQSDNWELNYEKNNLQQWIRRRDDDDYMFDILTLKFSEKDIKYHFGKYSRSAFTYFNKNEKHFIDKIRSEVQS